MDEAELLATIIGTRKKPGLCDELGVRWFHVFDPRTGPAGFPDLVLVGRRILYAELKGPVTRLTQEQRAWGRDLARAGAWWVIWRPGDYHSGRIRKEMEAIA